LVLDPSVNPLCHLSSFTGFDVCSFLGCSFELLKLTTYSFFGDNQGQASEWALLRRHEEEDLFGVQICGSHADTVSRAAELIERNCTIDFIDLNLGCPIDLVVNKGGGSSLLCKPTRLKEIVKATSATIDTPLTLKVSNSWQ
jgi:dihydroorotate dehydrogenase